VVHTHFGWYTHTLGGTHTLWVVHTHFGWYTHTLGGTHTFWGVHTLGGKQNNQRSPAREVFFSLAFSLLLALCFVFSLFLCLSSCDHSLTDTRTHHTPKHTHAHTCAHTHTQIGYEACHVTYWLTWHASQPISELPHSRRALRTPLKVKTHFGDDDPLLKLIRYST
jgi:hypothetical protein